MSSRKQTRGVYARRRATAKVAVLVISASIGLLPSLAGAHDWQPGGTGPQLHVSPDGYPPGAPINTSHPLLTVQGKGFSAPALAQIFLCKAGKTPEPTPVPEDPLTAVRFGPGGAADCGSLLRAIETTDGTFSTEVHINSFTQGGCFGANSGVIWFQCAIVAVTFDPTTLRPTSQAEHYVCFRSTGGGPSDCTPGPTDSSTTSSSSTSSTTTMPPTTTTSTVPPPRQLQISPSNDVPDGGTIQVSGSGFSANSVTAVYQCGRSGELLAPYGCKTLGAAPIDDSGAFSGEFVVTSALPINGATCANAETPIHEMVLGFPTNVPCAIWVSTTQVTRGDISHPICFEGPTPCAPTTTTIPPTTTTTTAPPPTQRNDVADFDGNGSTDVSVFRPTDGMWYVKDGAWAQWGQDGDIPVPGDYDGDGTTDRGIFRPSTGLWAIDYSGPAPDLFVTYGIATDVPVVADYDGDGKSDIAIFRPEYGLWWVRQSSTDTDVPTTFGIATDVPVPADYDGDTKADLAVYRDGTWFTLPSSGGDYTAINYGAAGDVPAVGDYDGDDIADRAVFRAPEGAWHVHRSSDNGEGGFAFGSAGDVPVPGDYSGDGETDAATFTPSTGVWSIRSGTTVSWGSGTDIPLPLPYSVRRAFFAP